MTINSEEIQALQFALNKLLKIRRIWANESENAPKLVSVIDDAIIQLSVQLYDLRFPPI